MFTVPQINGQPALFRRPSWELVNPAELHRSMQTRALFGRVISFLTGRSRDLLDLSEAISRSKIRRQYSTGTQPIAIDRIKGSEGRTGDFDRGFNPTHSRTLERWVSVAKARDAGVSLPAVELIQLGDDYFVRDGHHRISVAHALHEETIDARVTVLELEPVVGPLHQLGVA